MEKLMPPLEDMNKESNFLIDLVNFLFHGSTVNQTSSNYSHKIKKVPFSYSYPWLQPLKIFILSQILLFNEIKVFTKPGK